MPVLTLSRSLTMLAPLALLLSACGSGGGGGGGGSNSASAAPAAAPDLTVGSFVAGPASREGDRLGAVSSTPGGPPPVNGSTARFSITNNGSVATNASVLVGLRSGPFSGLGSSGAQGPIINRPAQGNRLFDSFTIAQGFAPGARIDAGVAAVLDGADVPLLGFRGLAAVLTDGSAILSLVVDASDAVAEVNEGNNTVFENGGARNFAAVTGGFDLVSAEQLTTSNAGVITPGVDFFTNVSVANVGDTGTGNYTVAVFAILPGGSQQLIGTASAFPLAAGARDSIRVTCNLPLSAAAGPGEGQIMASIGFNPSLGGFLSGDPNTDNNVARDRAQFTN